MLERAEEGEQVYVIKMSRDRIPISHLFFAEDSFIFFQANLEECQHVKRISDQFYPFSGEIINMDKSEFVVSRNCHTRFMRMFYLA